MNKKTKGLLAGAAGAALLLGGGTFALWSDSEIVNGGTITTGNLDVALVGDLEWRDASQDRTDFPHAIDLETFRIIPGDVIEGTFGLEAALEGENMVAALGVDSTSLDDNVLFSVIDVTLTITDGQGDEVLSHDWKGTPVEVLFASEDNGNPEGLPTLPVDTDGTADFRVVITAEFDEDTSERDFVQASAALGNATISLNQVREEAPGYN